jgi:phosphoglycerate kinase
MKSSIASWNLKNKRVFLRIDGNVPIKDDTILDDFRLKALLPTIQLLHSKGAKITLATHIGQPKKDTTKFSTQPLAAWFTQQGYGPEQNVIMLENLRFADGEQKQSKEFAEKLKNNNEYYVNDAWGTLHRNDTSISLLPKLFAPNKRSIGLLIEHELTSLNKLKINPPKPYTIFLGGGKIATKLPILEQLIDNKIPTTIALLPAIVFTFLHAQGIPVGKSLVDISLLGQAQCIMEKAKKNGIELLFPLDYLCALNSWNDGQFEMYLANNIPDNAFGMGVGPKSLELFKQKIAEAQTVFYNGAMGNPNRPESLQPLHELLHAMANSSAYTVVGGGNSIEQVQQLGLFDKISYCSTGGGSTLAYISGEKLPGLEVLKK